MEIVSETTATAGPAVWTPGAPVGDADVQQLARTFAVTPEAARLAVARVGTDFRALQRELGGRR
ncbi:DUF3606 domain-containing protein [Roseibacterium beibuensis]|uniref:DUF3606 domain-containing protein n=1 Tax=[Roseibacterium] beibuensis TaxID=1193142 RepID=UPI00217E6048|nr:DUF3606 domain-containing protein [Roseibacterium beibuensis]MCS6627482.1 DUF3606 domain-containing protein [Roseibacterium beibuensis]